MMFCILNFTASRFIVDRIRSYKHDLFSAVSIRNSIHLNLSGGQSDGYPGEEDIYLFEEQCMEKDPDDSSLDILNVFIHFKIGSPPLKEGWFEFHPPEVFTYALSEYVKDIELLYMDSLMYYNSYSIKTIEYPPQQYLNYQEGVPKVSIRKNSFKCKNTRGYESLSEEQVRIVNSFLTSPLSQYLQMIPVFQS